MHTYQKGENIKLSIDCDFLFLEDSDRFYLHVDEGIHN